MTFNKNEPAALDTLWERLRRRTTLTMTRAPSSRLPSRSIRRIRRRSSRSQRPTRSKTTFRWRLQTIGRVLAIDPRNIQALVFKADLYARQHDDAQAVEAYDDAIVAAPTDDQKVTIMTRKAGYFIAENKDARA